VKEKNNHAGSKTLCASIKEKETHYPEGPMENKSSGDLEGGWQPPAPDQGLGSVLYFQARLVAVSL